MINRKVSHIMKMVYRMVLFSNQLNFEEKIFIFECFLPYSNREDTYVITLSLIYEEAQEVNT